MRNGSARGTGRLVIFADPLELLRKILCLILINDDQDSIIIPA